MSRQNQTANHQEAPRRTAFWGLVPLGSRKHRQNGQKKPTFPITNDRVTQLKKLLTHRLLNVQPKSDSHEPAPKVFSEKAKGVKQAEGLEQAQAQAQAITERLYELKDLCFEMLEELLLKNIKVEEESISRLGISEEVHYNDIAYGPFFRKKEARDLMLDYLWDRNGRFFKHGGGEGEPYLDFKGSSDRFYSSSWDYNEDFFPPRGDYYLGLTDEELDCFAGPDGLLPVYVEICFQLHQDRLEQSTCPAETVQQLKAQLLRQAERVQQISAAIPAKYPRLHQFLNGLREMIQGALKSIQELIQSVKESNVYRFFSGSRPERSNSVPSASFDENDRDDTSSVRSFSTVSSN